MAIYLSIIYYFDLFIYLFFISDMLVKDMEGPLLVESCPRAVILVCTFLILST